MDLFEKYNKPVPRYTSYPTVPCWQKTPPTQHDWLKAVQRRLTDGNALSLYVHLPFCEQLCTYCGCNKRITKNHQVEAPYVDTVLAEWKIYLQSFQQKPVLKELHYGGGTPTFFSPAELKRLTKGILDSVTLAPNADLSFEAHPNSSSWEHLETMAEIGFNRISIGIQDFNPAILRTINRQQSVDDVVRTVTQAQALGYRSINFDIIYGLPGQTAKDVATSVEKIAELKPERIAFYGYAHVPWNSPGQRAYAEKDLPQGKEKWSLYKLGKQKLEALGYRDIGLDHFALPHDELYKAHKNGSLHRNFMGYTTNNSKLTIGLGCSSISDSWDYYVQNEKSVEAYAKIVNEEGRLPIIKGHELSENEQLTRRHILNLMCHQSTTWYQSSDRYPGLARAIDHWDDMVRDGIIRRDLNQLTVTPKGRPFLRNICLPLDDLYWSRTNEGPIFSKAI